MLKGYDCFFTMPGSVDTRICKVCESVCDIQREVLGYTGYAAAMSKKKTLHDQFVCPYEKEKWHKQALELVKEIEKCPSPSLVKIMKKDLKDMIKGL